MARIPLELLSQFAKVTNDSKKEKKTTIMYGTVSVKKGTTYVTFDGAKDPTPVLKTMDAKDGDYVKVEIRNHVATIAGNATNPASGGSSIDIGTDVPGGYMFGSYGKTGTILVLDQTGAHIEMSNRKTVLDVGEKLVYKTMDGKEIVSITDNEISLNPQNGGKLTVNGSELVTKDEIPTFDKIYPVGSIYPSFNDTDPSLLFGGKWERLKNRFLLGASDEHLVESIGGSTEHSHKNPDVDGTVLSIEQMPSHDHTINPNATHTYGIAYCTDGLDGISGHCAADGYAGGAMLKEGYTTIDKTGGGKEHIHSQGDTESSSSMPPFIAVYMWRRIE